MWLWMHNLRHVNELARRWETIIKGVELLPKVSCSEAKKQPLDTDRTTNTTSQPASTLVSLAAVWLTIPSCSSLSSLSSPIVYKVLVSLLISRGTAFRAKYIERPTQNAFYWWQDTICRLRILVLTLRWLQGFGSSGLESCHGPVDHLLVEKFHWLRSFCFVAVRAGHEGFARSAARHLRTN